MKFTLSKISDGKVLILKIPLLFKSFYNNIVAADSQSSLNLKISSNLNFIIMKFFVLIIVNKMINIKYYLNICVES